jgi:hypothetical protein
MSNKVYLAIIVLVVLVVSSVAAFYALQTPQEEETTNPTTAGVKAGDTFTYSMTGTAELGEEDITIPENFLEINMTDYYKVTITEVDGPIVSFNTTLKFTNGTQFDRTGQVNIETGANSEEFWAIYAANLTTGDPSRPEVADSTTINATETRTYLDGDRETNFLRAEGEFYDTTDLTYSTYYYDYTYVHFDSQTGMLVELKNIKIYSDPQIIYTVQWNLIDSNVLQVS